MTQIETRKSFSRKLPRFQTAWDSTSLGTFKTCPRKYQLSIIEGWRSRGSSLHLRYGILYHRALEVYDHKISEGLPHDEALKTALRDLAEGCLEPDRSWWNTEDTSKSVPNLFRTVVWYLERFGENDPARTLILNSGKPAVELSFRFEFGVAGTGEPILLSGHMDRMVEFQGMLWVLDRKTTKTTLGSYYFEQYNPNNQMTLYTLAGQVVFDKAVRGVIVDAAQIAVGFSRFERGFTTRSATQLSEWTESFFDYVRMAEDMADAEFWPMNDTACGNYGGCQFRGICNKSPEVRQQWLAGSFDIQKWDPLQTRGDI